VSWTWIEVSSPAIALGLGALALIYAIAGRRKFERTFASTVADISADRHVIQVETLMALTGYQKTRPLLLSILVALEAGAVIFTAFLLYSSEGLFSQGRAGEHVSDFSLQTKFDAIVVLMGLLFLVSTFVTLIEISRSTTNVFKKEMDEAASRVTKELLDQIRADHASR
jgi:hypothetical protein